MKKAHGTNRIVEKAIENENRTTIGQWSVDRRRKGINKPERGYCFTMEQTSFGRMESFSFLLFPIIADNLYVDRYNQHQKDKQVVILLVNLVTRFQPIKELVVKVKHIQNSTDSWICCCH
jgi:hypothetical protein